jgi:NADH dehydrogenase FAD-containing subunit
MSSAEQQRREECFAQSTEEKGELLDFVIVGAGPHALAFACRLLESKPDSLYDEKDLTTRHKYHPGIVPAPTDHTLVAT